MIISLSHKIDSSTPMYGGKKGFEFKIESSISRGDTANTQRWTFPNHLGTHIDTPYHFYQNGKKLDGDPPSFWFFKGEKIQILNVKLPEKKLLIEPTYITNKDISYDAELLILKTGVGKHRNKEKFWKYNPGISQEFAIWIKEKFKKLRVVATDSISVSSWQHRDVGRKVHKILLNPKKPVLIIEDMDLSKIASETVFKMLYIAPITVKGADGGPCTIFAEVQKK